MEWFDVVLSFFWYATDIVFIIGIFFIASVAWIVWLFGEFYRPPSSAVQWFLRFSTGAFIVGTVFIASFAWPVWLFGEFKILLRLGCMPA